ncbi:MAG: hypothetical protein DRO05_08150 [Thermoproteota archaeon]|nr:MAG: hypothetical protein DRO05_08150 [Candidatus Korarchaeota archaeon]
MVVIPNGVDCKEFHPNWNKEKLKGELGVEGGCNTLRQQAFLQEGNPRAPELNEDLIPEEEGCQANRCWRRGDGPVPEDSG